MANEYSVDDISSFLEHASERGLMPAATSQALAVAARNVFSVLSDEERADVRQLDLDAAIKRFNNKRAKDFNPSSLKEYGRRAHRAVALFLQWKEDPANFAPKTRAPSGRTKRPSRGDTNSFAVAEPEMGYPSTLSAGKGYQSAFPVRPGMVVTLSNIPNDLTSDEAERLAQFVRLLAIG